MDTLAYHKARPLQSNIDLSEASLRHVMKGYSDIQHDLKKHDNGVKAHPETDALWFYVQQHAMGLTERNLDSDEPMGDYTEFVEEYHITIQRKALRMFYYILLICTRESRHMNNGVGKTKVWAKYPNIHSFHSNHVQDSSAEEAIQAVIDNAPDVTLGEYGDFLVDAFAYPSYGSGFGGKAWKKVAKPLRDFIHGKISAEILMDTAFTLAHNNGPIFNKGMLFHNYNGSKLNKILDVQRSGQIPQLIANHQEEFGKYISATMRAYVADFTRLDSGFGGAVDWKMVKNIKGMVAYKIEVKKQEDADNAVSLIDKLKAKAETIKATAAAFNAKAAKAALLKGCIEIFPGVTVAKGKRSIS